MKVREKMTTRWLGMVGSLVALAVLSLTSFAAHDPGSEKAGGSEKLLGAWRLAYVEEPGPDGKMVREERQGTLMYTSDGRMAVQIVVPPNAPAESGPIQYEACGYEAYYGTYTLDAPTSTVTHNVEGALVRTLVGQHLGRRYRFSGKQLILTSTRTEERWSITWERY